MTLVSRFHIVKQLGFFEITITHVLQGKNSLKYLPHEVKCDLRLRKKVFRIKEPLIEMYPTQKEAMLLENCDSLVSTQ